MATKYDLQFVTNEVHGAQRPPKCDVFNQDIGASEHEQDNDGTTYDIDSTFLEVLQDGTYNIGSTLEVL